MQRHPPLGHRRGQVWDDLQTLNKIIHNTRFNLTSKSRQEFELAYMSSVNANADRINGQIMSQVDKDTYLKGANEEEKDLEEIFQDLSSDMNIFSYIVPAFTPGPNVKALLAWNDIGG